MKQRIKLLIFLKEIKKFFQVQTIKKMKKVKQKQNQNQNQKMKIKMNLKIKL